MDRTNSDDLDIIFGFTCSIKKVSDQINNQYKYWFVGITLSIIQCSLGVVSVRFDLRLKGYPSNICFDTNKQKEFKYHKIIRINLKLLHYMFKGQVEPPSLWNTQKGHPYPTQYSWTNPFELLCAKFHSKLLPLLLLLLLSLLLFCSVLLICFHFICSVCSLVKTKERKKAAATI